MIDPGGGWLERMARCLLGAHHRAHADKERSAVEELDQARLSLAAAAQDTRKATLSTFKTQRSLRRVDRIIFELTSDSGRHFGEHGEENGGPNHREGQT